MAYPGAVNNAVTGEGRDGGPGAPRRVCGGQQRVLAPGLGDAATRVAAGPGAAACVALRGMPPELAKHAVWRADLHRSSLLVLHRRVAQVVQVRYAES